MQQVNPLYANVVAARSEGLHFLVERLDGPSGDFNPNISLQMTLGMFATTPQWLALPFCEHVSVTVEPVGLDQKQQEVLMIEDDQKMDNGAGGSMGLTQRQAQRQLIGGFGLSEEEQALIQRRLVCGCC